MGSWKRWERPSWSPERNPNPFASQRSAGLAQTLKLDLPVVSPSGRNDAPSGILTRRVFANQLSPTPTALAAD